ncbi:MAG TPA: AmmeMemoRadiSam system protein B [bacterium]|nr:AmmeMemoRadiSam system protein B [bacterium]
MIRRITFFCILLNFIGTANGFSADIRYSVHAGHFYPSNAGELERQIEEKLKEAQKRHIPGPIRAIWVPHAGYVFSGWVAANAYELVRGADVDVVIVLGVSHYFPLRGVSVGDWSHYQTPLGLAKTDTVLIRELCRHETIHTERRAHIHEHSIEVQIPFIQTVLPGRTIVPILIGRISYEEARNTARILAEVTRDRKVLFIASSDMSHFPGYEEAYRADGEILQAVQAFDARKVFRLNETLPLQKIPGLEAALCGGPALVVTMLTARLSGADRVQVLLYRNSGDVTGERNRVVGYGAAVFYHPPSINRSEGVHMTADIHFTREEKQTLFSIARKSIDDALKGRIWNIDPSESPNLNLERGIFVTLTNRGRLRGCIGHFEADRPLYEMVARMAAAAAAEDYRFSHQPVTPEEMDEIDIKISILSEMKKIDSIDEIQIGRHGIWVRQGLRGGTYLPEVAMEMGWNQIEFLEHCCVEKAGLPRDAWKKGADVYIYSSQILDERWDQ